MDVDRFVFGASVTASFAAGVVVGWQGSSLRRRWLRFWQDYYRKKQINVDEKLASS